MSNLSWGEVLAPLATERPTDLAVRYLSAPERQAAVLTRAELHDGAMAAARVLSAQGARGERVVLFARSQRGFLEWFLGCLIAGATAVPCVPPRGRDRASKLKALIDHARVRIAVGTRTDRKSLPNSVVWFDDQAHLGHSEPGPLPEIPAADPAVLQYTSGSTRQPRAVMLTSEALMANVADIRAGFGLTPRDHLLVWLPAFHDMGLIGGLLTPVLTGIPVTVMPPSVFAQEPVGWLSAISHWGATVSGGPTTGYEVVARQLEGAPETDLDLSRWRTAFVGAEPVLESALARFAAATQGTGFQPTTLRPCYGMAEATLFVSCAEGVSADRALDGSVAVRCGPTPDGTEVRAVRDGRECPVGEIGELWVAGPGVAAGYWSDPAATEQVFGARIPGSDRSYLRTGDLGFLTPDGVVVPTGRLKDILIVNGRNVIPTDLEFAACRAAEPRTVGLAAVFTLDRPDQIAVLVEVANSRSNSSEATLAAIVAAVGEEVGLVPTVTGLVRLGSLDRTTSGKVRRSTVRERFMARDLVPDHAIDERGVENELWRKVATLRDRLAGASRNERASVIGAHIHQVLERGSEGDGIGIPVPAPGPGFLRETLNSLSQIALLHELELLAGTSLPRTALLGSSSVDEMAELVASHWEEVGTPASEDSDIACAPLDQWHKAGDAESGMYLWESVVPAATVLTVAADVLRGWSVPALRDALTGLVDRHEILRTSYRIGGDEVQRRVLPPGSVSPSLAETDGTGWSQERIRRWTDGAAKVLFDLAQPPLLAVNCLTTGEDTGVLVLSVPHVVADFRSLTLLLADIARSLGTRGANAAPPTYREHLAVTEQHLASTAAEVSAGRLRAQSEQFSPYLAIPGRRSGPAPVGGPAVGIERHLDSAMVERIDALARSRGTTRFCVMLALYQVALQRLTGRRDVVVGTPFHGRRARFTATLGLFMNHVPVVGRIGASDTFVDMISQTSAAVERAYDDQWVPLPTWTKGHGRSAPFETLFVLHQTPFGEPEALGTFGLRDGAELAVGPATWRSRHVPNTSDTVPLTFMAGADSGGLALVFRSLAEVIDETTLELVADTWTSTADELLNAPEELLLARTAPEVDFDARSGVTSVVDELYTQVRCRPDAIAVVDRSRSLTYSQLWAETERAAAGLQGLGIGSGSVMALLLPRSVEAVVVTFGALRAGAACLHLDRADPPARLKRMCGTAGARLVVTTHADQALVEHTDVEVHTVEDLLAAAAGPVNRARPSGEMTAYINFTSGSSGEPKAVVVSHKAVVAAVRAFGDVLAMGPGDHVCCVSPLGWDIVVGDFFAAPMRGATLILAAEDTAREPELLGRFLSEHRASMMTTTPTRWRMLIESGWRPPPGFRAGTGGDTLPPETATALQESGVHVWNFYGPTETVLFATAAELRSWRAPAPVPVGSPLAGYRTHLAYGDEGTDEGEIVIGGDVVADGYLGDPRATAERLVPDPGGEPGSRMYLTGDVARDVPGAGMAFVGRVDQQVKIRGFRVEPGEVEQAVLREPGVARALVGGVGEGTAKELAAFVVPSVGASLKAADMVAALSAELPAHMIPRRWAFGSELPLTPNGKVDRGALASIGRDEVVGEAGALAHGSAGLVASAMAEVLDVPSVPADANFFALGGHSMLAFDLVSRLSSAVGAPVPLGAVFERPTAVDLGAFLDAERDTSKPIGDVGSTGDVPLTPGQRALWLQALLQGGGSVMVLPYLVELTGVSDSHLLTTAFDHLVAMHESLRTVILMDESGEPRQSIGPAPTLHVVDLEDDPHGDLIDLARDSLRGRISGPWDLSQPLVAASVHRRGSTAVLGMAIHHIVSDGWSARVLLEDFVRLCSSLARGNSGQQPSAEQQHHAHMMARRLSSVSAPEVVDRFAATIVGATRLELPRTREPQSGADKSGGGQGEGGRCRRSVGDRTYRLARALDATPYAVTTAAFLCSLRTLTGQNDLVTGFDVAGRTTQEMERLVGYFGGQRALRVDLGEAADLADATRLVASALSEAMVDAPVGWDEVVSSARRADPRFEDPLNIKIVQQFVPREFQDRRSGIRARRRDPDWVSTAFPLALWIWEDGSETELEVHWRSEECDEKWVIEIIDMTVETIMEFAGAGTKAEQEE